MGDPGVGVNIQAAQRCEQECSQRFPWGCSAQNLLVPGLLSLTPRPFWGAGARGGSSCLVDTVPFFGPLWLCSGLSGAITLWAAGLGALGARVTWFITVPLTCVLLSVTLFINTCHGHGGLCEVLRCSPRGCWPHRASRLVRRTLHSPSSLPVALPLLYSRCHLLGSDPVVKCYSNDRCHDLRSLTLCQACAVCLTITYYPPLAPRKAYFPTL